MTNPRRAVSTGSGKREDALAWKGLDAQFDAEMQVFIDDTVATVERYQSDLKRAKVDVRRWPFRQDDPRWAKDLMWDRKAVMAIDPEAGSKLRKTNNIGSDGCQLTSMAMVLKVLAPKCGTTTPSKLNKFAHKERYYTLSGVSMVPIYADLVSEASGGQVQMFLKEEYLAGEAGWPRNHATDCVPLTAYRRLNRTDRRDIVLMLKTGTFDDTFASHYVLVDPEAPGGVKDDDVPILDPVQPLASRVWPWRLSDSAKRLRTDSKIDKEWRKKRIQDLQIGGVWAFARWSKTDDSVLGGALFDEIARIRRGVPRGKDE